MWGPIITLRLLLLLLLLLLLVLLLLPPLLLPLGTALVALRTPVVAHVRCLCGPRPLPAQLVAMFSRPVGPSSQIDRMKWYKDTVSRLFGSLPSSDGDWDERQRREVFMTNMQDLRTMGHYSGQESMSMAMGFVVKEMQTRGWPIELPRNMHACDKSTVCQTILTSYRGNERPACVFQNMSTRLPAHLQTALDAMEPSKSASPEKRVAQYNLIRDMLLKYFADDHQFNVEVQDYCCVHKRQCRVYQHLLPHRPGLLLSFAGHVCVDWSRMGKKQGTGGPSARYFWQWVGEAARLGPELVFTECTPDFDPELFGPLKHMYDISTMVLEPQDFGDCIRRSRRFCVLSKRDSIMLSHSLSVQSFLSILGRTRSPTLKARSLFSAPPEVVLAHHRHLARQRHVLIEGCSDDAILKMGRKLLTGASLGRLRNYECTVKAKLEGHQLADGDEVFFDLHQNADKGGAPRMSVNELFCLVTHGETWSPMKARPSTGTLGVPWVAHTLLLLLLPPPPPLLLLLLLL